MPIETQDAVNWSLTQTITYQTDFGEYSYPVTTETHQDLVDMVRKYFNDNQIEYTGFSYDDLKAYLPTQQTEEPTV